MNHKRKKPRHQRAACFCKFGKKMGIRALRGGQSADGGLRGSDLRLRERAREAA